MNSCVYIAQDDETTDFCTSSSLLPFNPSVAVWKPWKNSSLGILPLPLKPVAVATGCPLLCLSAHHYLGSSQADPCSMWHKRSVLTQETEDGKTRWWSIFSRFPCDPEPDTLLVCSSAPVVLSQEECGVYLNSTTDFVQSSFSSCDISVSLHPLPSDTPAPAEFLTAKPVLYPPPLFKIFYFYYRNIEK